MSAGTSYYFVQLKYSDMMLDTTSLSCLYIVAVLWLSVPVEPARRVDAHMRARETMRLQRAVNMMERRAMTEVDLTVNELLQLTEGETMSRTRETSNALGTKVERLRENYNGVLVFDSTVTVRTDSRGRLTGDASGMIIQDIADDLPDIHANLSDKETLEIAIQNEGDEQSRNTIGSISFQRTIYTDKQDVAHLANIVTYLIDGTKRPTYIIDVKTGDILLHYDALDTFSCGKKTYKAVGGNEKAGKIKYGKVPYCLAPRIEGRRCYLENKYVRVIDMLYGEDEDIDKTASFKCKKGYRDKVNGAYSPATDAFFYGTIVGKMFEEWFQSTALHDQIVLRVHYGRLYNNAFWNGENTTFGDGNSEIYPFTSIDVVGHEIAHGITEQGSSLMYIDEAGGVNEAFSDIIGESAEEFLRSSDFQMGKDIMKHLPFMRDFEDPTLDEASIRHVDDMYPTLDPHYSSGIYRRIWFVVVKKKGMPIRDAAKVFVHANRMYWHHMSTFYDCACGILKAAIDLGYSVTPFEHAFKDVGIANCIVSEHIFSLANNITQPDVLVSSSTWPVFRFECPAWADRVIAKTVNARGVSITIEAQEGNWEDDDTGHVEGERLLGEGVGSLEITEVANKEIFLRFSSDDLEELADTAITVGYTCLQNYDADDEFDWYCSE